MDTFKQFIEESYDNYPVDGDQYDMLEEGKIKDFFKKMGIKIKSILKLSGKEKKGVSKNTFLKNNSLQKQKKSKLSFFKFKSGFERAIDKRDFNTAVGIAIRELYGYVLYKSAWVIYNKVQDRESLRQYILRYEDVDIDGRTINISERDINSMIKYCQQKANGMHMVWKPILKNLEEWIDPLKNLVPEFSYQYGKGAIIDAMGKQLSRGNWGDDMLANANEIFQEPLLNK